MSALQEVMTNKFSWPRILDVNFHRQTHILDWFLHCVFTITTFTLFNHSLPTNSLLFGFSSKPVMKFFLRLLVFVLWRYSTTAPSIVLIVRSSSKVLHPKQPSTPNKIRNQDTFVRFPFRSQLAMDYGYYSSESYASTPSQTTYTYNSSWGGGEDRQPPFDLDPQVR